MRDKVVCQNQVGSLGCTTLAYQMVVPHEGVRDNGPVSVSVHLVAQATIEHLTDKDMRMAGHNGVAMRSQTC